MKFQYLCHPREDSLTIFHVGSYSNIGSVRLRGAEYHVQTIDDDEMTIAIVKSIGEAIPALLDHYEKHPPRWQGDGATGYWKSTQFGVLRVEQDQLGQWLAYRNDGYHLLRDGKPALFPTAEEAQGAADAHLRDGLLDAKVNNDGLSWLHDPLFDLWSYPFG
jgi:hypothetical protein